MNSLARPFLFVFMLAGWNHSDKICSNYSWGGTVAKCEWVVWSGVLCLLSVSIMFIHVPVQALIQRKTPNEYMSRTFSIVWIITKGGIPIGALMYGFILNSIEVHWTIFSATILIMLISVLFLISLSKAHDI